MFNSKKKKLIAFVLSAFMAVSVFGTTIASAHPHDDPPPPRPHYDEPASPPPHHHRHWVDGHWNHDHHWVRGHWENR
ncbi:hypothetical protein [Pectinatus brassicae]|uniref:Uncharacterized protein n=1 Tax=Pectinatus brassicae TaxID=862415 RepID=A0A840UNQ7_9FIRM|nr:hypothetical protein [Pectinatus brassicae]MBB5337537.1 hypothetical protein [Pectinatus brassicae]